MDTLNKLWQGWKKYGQFIGDIIGRIVLTIFYFTIFLPFGIGVRLLGDPLSIRPSVKSIWLDRHTYDRNFDDARRLS